MSVAMRYCLAALLLAPASPGAEKAGKMAMPSKPGLGLKTPGVLIPFDKLKTEAEIAIGGAAGPPAFTPATVLVPVASGDTIVRVDPKTNKPGEPIKVAGKPCGGIVNAFGSLWTASCATQDLIRIDAKSGTATASLPAGAASSARVALAASADSLWLLADDRTSLLRIDPAGNSIVADLRLPAGCTSILFAEGSLWIPCPGENKVLRIDPKTHLVTQRIETSAKPIALTFGEASIWVYCETAGKVSRIDPKTNKVIATVDAGIPGLKGEIVFGDGSVWLSAPGFPLSRIAATSDKVVQQFAGEGGGQIHFGAGSLWLAHPGKGTLARLDPKRVVATLAE